jgi:phosphoglycerate dehydrogenase-like enzyme
MRMSTPIVAITELEYRKAANFAASADLLCVSVPEEEHALAEAILKLNARHVVVGLGAYRDELYSALPRGGVLARYGVGHDGIDREKASAAGLLCTNTPGVLDQSVAELTLFLIGAAARRLPMTVSGMCSSEWSPRTGNELHGKTLVLVGPGPVGRAVARMATFGFGMRTLGVARSRDLHYDGFESITDDFDSAAGEADFLSLHIPATAPNARFLNAARLSRLPTRNGLLIPPVAWS